VALQREETAEVAGRIVAMNTLILSRPDRVGDAIISTSCLAAIRERHPGVKIYFVATERMRPLLEGHPWLAGFIPLSMGLTAEFRRLKADALVHLNPQTDVYYSGERAGIPLRVGYPLSWFGGELTHKIADRRREGLRHEAAYNFELLRPLNVTAPGELSASVHLPPESLTSLQRKLPWQLVETKFAVFSPTAQVLSARWAKANFLEVAKRLREEFDLPSVFIGAEADETLPAGSKDLVNLTGKTDLGELARLLKRARVLITNASGPSHLAAAVACPSVTLFGRTAPMYSPTRWRPLSPEAVVIAKPVARKFFERKEEHWRRGFAAVSVEEVVEAARGILKRVP
jgi:ADP-heptose:LPS heptosyltransferase